MNIKENDRETYKNFSLSIQTPINVTVINLGSRHFSVRKDIDRVQLGAGKAGRQFVF